jgi:hypothetical protein
VLAAVGVAGVAAALASVRVAAFAIALATLRVASQAGGESTVDPVLDEARFGR